MPRLANPKAKGNRLEREAKRILEAMDYDVVKAGGSLGAFDLVAVPKHPHALYGPKVRLIQCKANRISGKEIKSIAAHVTLGQKEAWVRKDRQPWKAAIIHNQFYSSPKNLVWKFPH